MRACTYLYFRKRVIRWGPTTHDTRNVGEVRPEARIHQAREGGRVLQRGENGRRFGETPRQHPAKFYHVVGPVRWCVGQ